MKNEEQDHATQDKLLGQKEPLVPRNQHPLIPQPARGLGQANGAVLEPLGKKLALGPLLAGRAPGRASPSVSWLSE